MLIIYHFLSHCTNRIPHRDETYDYHGYKNQHYVPRPNADGIGIDDVCPFLVSDSYYAIILLNETKGKTYDYSRNGTYE